MHAKVGRVVSKRATQVISDRPALADAKSPGSTNSIPSAWSRSAIAVGGWRSVTTAESLSQPQRKTGARAENLVWSIRSTTRSAMSMSSSLTSLSTSAEAYTPRSSAAAAPI